MVVADWHDRAMSSARRIAATRSCSLPLSTALKCCRAISCDPALRDRARYSPSRPGLPSTAERPSLHRPFARLPASVLVSNAAVTAMTLLVIRGSVNAPLGGDFFIRRSRHLLRKQGIDKLRIDFAVTLARRKPMHALASSGDFSDRPHAVFHDRFGDAGNFPHAL